MAHFGLNQELDNLNDNRIDNSFEEEPNRNFNSNANPTKPSPEEINKEAQELRPLLESFDEEFNNPENKFFYIISAQWLRNWKMFSSYDNKINDDPPTEDLFEKVYLQKINEDIIQEPNKVAKYPDEDDYRNIFLKEELHEKRDYEIITEAAWNYIAKKYQNTPIKRPVYTRPDGMRYVEVYLKQIRLVPVNNNFLRDVDHGRVREFKLHLIQVSAQTILKDFKLELAQVCNMREHKHWFEAATSYMGIFTVSEETIRLWKLDPALDPKTFFQNVKKTCDECRSYDYQIEFKGTLVEKDKEIKLEDAQIAQEDLIFLEARDSHKGWSFFGDGAPVVSKCEFCNKYGELPVQCACKKVSYCNNDCKNSDKRYHQSRCDKAGEDEEKESETLVANENSKHGLVGLQNLGNTCFMNSGLQCMSNIKELSQYFLLDKYLGEINETNPLGTKGKLVKKYASFLKHLWFGSASVYSPWSLKTGIAEFQPMFSGYQQHDSQELLAFLIDGLHEDLNRVKVKPFTETIESEGHNDYEAALKSWETHLKRNQSIIVDLLHGQFKSQITCPKCARVSITFDPFNTVSLPISIKKEKEIDFFFIFAKNKKKSVKIAFSYDKATHTIAQLKEQTAKVVGEDPKSFSFVFSTYHSKELVTDEEKTMTNELRKKKKFKTLFALQFSDEDLNADPEDRFDVDVHPAKKAKSYYGSDIHKPLTFVRIVSLRKSYTLKQVYIKIFSEYRFVFDEKWPEEDREEWLKLSDEEAFQKVWEQAEKKPFNIHLVKNYTSSFTCYFCEQRRCENCIMPYVEDTKLSDLLNKITDPGYKFELELVFDDLPEFVNPSDSLNAYDDLTQKTAGKDDTHRGIAIKDCFDQFELPEQLGEENAWYCNKCKEHQRATKKMEIYKAPPILLLHFKRFKSGNSLYKKGKITEKVDFPMEDLDLSDYVINHELPTDYPVERLAPNFTVSTADQNQQTGGDVSDPSAEKMNIEKEESESHISNTELSDTLGKLNMEAASQAKTGLSYDLFAVVNHYGNLGFGHYTAFAKNHKDGQWYNFDDSRVSQEKPEDVCTPAAYVLFYKRKDWEFKI